MRALKAGFLGAALGGVVGATVTVALSQGRSVVRAGVDETLPTSSRPSATPGVSPHRLGPSQGAKTPSLAEDTAALVSRMSESHAACLAEATRLAGEVAALRRQVHPSEDVGSAEVGIPLPFPEDLPPEFSEVALRRSVQEGFEQAGVKVGSTTADCSEYPCILCTELPHKPRDEEEAITMVEDIERARKSPAMATYMNEERAWEWSALATTPTRSADGSLFVSTRFCQAFCPLPEEPEEASLIGNRVSFRFERMRQQEF